MRWTPTELARVTGGRLLSPSLPGPEPVVTSVAIDSRLVEPGALFVALRAERDGQDYITPAVAAGAVAYLCRDAIPVPARAWGIEVGDTSLALGELGKAARSRLDGPVIGITGSVGKTSTKDLTAAALASLGPIGSSPQSFNNEIGVPLTLLGAPPDARAMVVEMGARGSGHVAALCRIAVPTIGVVTEVSAAHLEGFGDLDQVAAAKAELVEALNPSGTAVLNADDRRVAAMAERTRANVVTYSASGEAGADLAALEVRLGTALRPTFRLVSPWGGGEVTLGVRGAHQVPNALAAAAVALVCGVEVADVLAALGQASLSPWRMELARSRRGAWILNDAYNANPASTAAALRSLAALDSRRKVAVLGPMAELGPRGPGLHREIAELAEALGVAVIAVGTGDYGMVPLAGLEAAAEALGDLGEGDAVLVKASRVAGLERLAARLLES